MKLWRPLNRWCIRISTLDGWSHMTHWILASTFRLLPRVQRADGLVLLSLELKSDDVLASIAVANLALDCIKEYDKRRYNRVRASFRWILIRREKSVASFIPLANICCLRSIAEKHLNKKEVVAYIARLFVHEATHAVIERKGIPYWRGTADQIERICEVEERRSLARLPASILTVNGDGPPSIGDWVAEARLLKWQPQVS